MSQSASTTLHGFWRWNKRLTTWWADDSVPKPFMLGSMSTSTVPHHLSTDRQLGCSEVIATRRNRSGPLTAPDQWCRPWVSALEPSGQRRFNIHRGEAAPLVA